MKLKLNDCLFRNHSMLLTGATITGRIMAADFYPWHKEKNTVVYSKDKIQVNEQK